MTDDPEKFPRPTRFEQRGEFPVHSDRVHAPLTRAQALALARKHLADWIAERGEGGGY